MSIRTALAIWLALVVGCQHAAAATRSPFMGLRFERLVSQAGMPDNAVKLRHGRTKYEWDLHTPDGLNVGNELTKPACRVTVLVSSRGFVTSIKTELSSIAAELYAGIGAFGCLCAGNFGVKQPLQRVCTSKPPFMTADKDGRWLDGARVEE